MMRKHVFSGIFLCLAVLIGGWFSYSVSAFSFKELLGIGTEEAEETKQANTEAHEDKPVIDKEAVKQNKSNSAKKIEAGLELSDLQKTLSVLDENQRKKLLADEKVFSDFVKQEASNISILAAARANEVDSNEKTQILVQRSMDSVIRELYLNQLIVSKIPADFPTDEQVQEYYDQNRDKFVIEERMHAWQIFLPVKEGTSKKDIELIKKKAESINSDLRKKKIDFASAANQYSRHEASRFNGGYMGLINISEMKPQIKTVIKTLKPGDISKSIKTDDGIHILKGGAIVPKQEITLEQAKSSIVDLMLKQLKIQIRQAVFKQASITYPIDLDDEKMEEWRLKLRAN